MKYFINIFLILISADSFSQSYNLYVKFEPSFIEQAEISITYNDSNLAYIELNNFYFNEKSYLNNKTLITLNNFLYSYKFDKTNNIRTGISIRNKDSITVNHIGFDGITVSGRLNINEEIKSFEFWSPKPKTINYELVSILFSITDSCFDKPKTQRYLNGIKSYFEGLTESKINDSIHIEFKIKKDSYTIVDKMPEFIGGKDSLRSYIERSIKENKIIRQSNISGKVYVNFIIDKTGNTSNVEILKGLQQEINNECMMIVLYMPKWIPGEHYGEKVKVSYVIPFEIYK